MKLKIFSRYFPPDFVGGAEVSTNHVAQALKDRFSIEINTLSNIHSNDFKINRLKQTHGLFEIFPQIYSSRLQHINKSISSEGIIWCADFFGVIATRGLAGRKVVTVRDYWPICPCGSGLMTNHSFCDGCTIGHQLNCLKIKESRLSRKMIRMLRYRLYASYNRQLIRRADHLVFISRWSAQKILSRIPLNHYSIINNPLSEIFITKRLEKNISKQILYVGTVKEYKGIDLLLQAMHLIVQQHSDIRLLVVGDGDINKYKKMAAELNLKKQVVFQGKVSLAEMIHVYDRSDIVLVPSIWPEPFGRTIIEGMARSCVPIASNHGGPMEIITNGENGFLCPAGNAAEPAEIITLLYNDKQRLRALQQRARADSIAKFHPAEIANQYAKLFVG